MTTWIQKHPFLIAFLALLFLTGVTYLPNATEFSLYNDDWYLIYDAHTQGASFFHEIYRSDRPGRAYVLEFIYTLFGNHILYYHLSAALYRAAAGAALFWALHKTWLRHASVAFTVAALFTIYPGFLSQPNPIDYQSQILSLFLAMLSIALTVASLQTASKIWQGFLVTGSILSGWAYLALVEYHIGLEILRLALLIAPLIEKYQPDIKNILWMSLKKWLPFSFTPLGYLIWRVFLFHSERRATDISSQLSPLLESPLTILWWGVNLFKNALMGLVLAWGVPLYQLGFNMRLSDNLMALATATLIVSSVLWLILRLKNAEPDNENKIWLTSNLVIGAVATIAGVFPVVIVNRSADFENYSRYLLASAAGSALFLTALGWHIKSHLLRNIFIGFLIFSAIITHYANAEKYQAIAKNQRDFWWQVAWRAPDIRDKTTLIAEYPVGSIQEDYFVWGPANLIYRSQEPLSTPIRIKLSAMVLTDDAILQILQGEKGDKDIRTRRGNRVVQDYKNTLLIVQANPNSCVRIIDGKFPEFSASDQHRTLLVASSSKIDNISTEINSAAPPALIFGSEPSHGWCYYYQKASLARQKDNWEQVIQFGEQALAEGFYPSDKIEWMPFLQAYTVLGQKEKLRPFVSILAESPYIQNQACTILSASAPDRGMLAYIQESFCKNP